MKKLFMICTALIVVLVASMWWHYTHARLPAGFTRRPMTTGTNNVGIGYAPICSPQAWAAWCDPPAPAPQSKDTKGHDALPAITIGPPEMSGRPLFSGQEDTVIGYNAGMMMTTAENDICIGANSCENLTTGSSDICIGRCPILTTQNGLLCINNSCTPNDSVPPSVLNQAIRELLATVSADEKR